MSAALSMDPSVLVQLSDEPATSPGLLVIRDLIESHGNPRDLSASQITPLRALFEEPTGAGLWLFSVLVCGLTKLTPTLHWEMCSFLSRWGTPGWRRLMMMVPRGSFKTSLGSKALPLWLASKDPEVTIGIFNAAQDQAKSWISSIRQILEGSTLYQQLWPERLPPGIHFRERDAGRSVPRSWKWGDTGVLLVRPTSAVSELTFEPYGIGGSSTGKHYTHRIMDDLIGETAALSPVLIEDSIHFVDHARSLERPPNGGCELVNCTPWAYRDCYSHMLTRWPNDYQVYRRSLLEDLEGAPDVVEGTSIFPESIPTEEARKMHAAHPFEFSSQYQCIPQAGRETAFQREWIRPCVLERTHNGEWCLRIPPDHYDAARVHSAVAGERAPDLVPLHWCDRVILVDPAPTKKGERTQEPRSRNGLVVVAEDPWGRCFTLQSVGLREDPVTVMETVVFLAVRWRVVKVGIEEVNFSSVYAPLWNALLRHRHPDLELSFLPLLTHGQDKDTRINSLKGPHRMGLWYYNTDLCLHVIQELLEYPNSEARDLIDAQAYWAQALGRPATPSEQESSWYGSYHGGRNAYTGY